MVGIGSFLFHTLAVTWAMYADVIPITLFIVAYLASGAPPVPEAAAPAGRGGDRRLRAVQLHAGADPRRLTGSDVSALTNGSIDYLPAVLALFTVAALDRPETRFVGTGRRLLVVGVLFLISLTARTIDRTACAVLPTGTHALWHLLNAWCSTPWWRPRFGTAPSWADRPAVFLRAARNSCRDAAHRRPGHLRAPGTEGIMTVSYRIGVAGLGTVGASVVRMIARRRDTLTASGLDIRVAAVSSRDRSRDRGLDLAGVTWFDDPVALARSGEVDCVVELIGGAEGPPRPSSRRRSRPARRW